jgi:hypothetical protein
MRRLELKNLTWHCPILGDTAVLQASALLNDVLRSVEEFANCHPADDDRT